MSLTDTVKLLQECNAGSKMAVSSIDEIMEKVKDEKLRAILVSCKDKHAKLGNEIHGLLTEFREEEKEPCMFEKGMAWAKTNVKMMMKDSDAAAADLLTDGCHMGIKTLRKFMNDYPEADRKAKNLCEHLIEIEEKFAEELEEFL